MNPLRIRIHGLSGFKNAIPLAHRDSLKRVLRLSLVPSSGLAVILLIFRWTFKRFVLPKTNQGPCFREDPGLWCFDWSLLGFCLPEDQGRCINFMSFKAHDIILALLPEHLRGFDRHCGEHLRDLG